ncbi:MAG: response regulator [Nitrospirae bacterium]|nr:response regulator [Nitrospirota bacterium]
MPQKILIVDDNDANRILFRDVLRYNGFETTEAENGEVGIQQALQQKPDLILLDIQMPVMDGYETLKVLREMAETRSVTIVALTSFAMSGDKKGIVAAGFDGYITKPISTRELPVVIRKYLSEEDRAGGNDNAIEED